MTEEELMEENRKNMRNIREMQEAFCKCFRNSGRNCRACKYFGTSKCVHPEYTTTSLVRY